jgi:predicted HicB family RNase H-like nuclease
MGTIPHITEYKGYMGTITYYETEGSWSGVVNLPRDVVTFQAKSAGLQIAFQESVDDYLDYCKEQGKPPETSQKSLKSSN